jgi:hypothetical protein
MSKKYEILGAGAALSVAMLGACTSESVEPPAPGQEQRLAAVEEIVQQLGVTSLDDVERSVATKWNECPTGPGATELPAGMHVNSYEVPPDFGVESTDVDMVEIGSPVYMYSEGDPLDGDSLVYCGESIGPDAFPGLGANPEAGTVVVIPRDSNTIVYNGGRHLGGQ